MPGHGIIQSLQALVCAAGGFPGVGAPAEQERFALAVLCGGHSLGGFVREVTPAAALFGGVVIGILYLWRGVAVEGGAPPGSAPPAS